MESTLFEILRFVWDELSLLIGVVIVVRVLRHVRLEKQRQDNRPTGVASDRATARTSEYYSAEIDEFQKDETQEKPRGKVAPEFRN